MDIVIDIETTGLEAESSQLIAIGILTNKGFSRIFFADYPKDEVKIIESFIETMRKLIDEENEEVRIITFYGSRFDIPYIYSRGLKLTAKGLLGVPEILYQQIDVYDIVKQFLKLSKNSLSDVCRFLGIPKLKELEGRDMANIYLEAISGKEEKKELIIVHLKDDLKVLLKLWETLKPLVKR